MTLAWATAQALYLFAPLLFSAVLSAVVHRYDLFPRLARPIDAGAMLGNERLFGDGKTWRGVVIAVVGSIVAALAQKYAVAERAGALAVVDYVHIDAVSYGAALGAGAMLGELPNSFVKRRLGMARGRTAKGWPLRVLFWTWDQVDLLTTAWPILTPWVRPRPDLVAASVAVALVLHPAVALVGYLLGARRTAR